MAERNNPKSYQSLSHRLAQKKARLGLLALLIILCAVPFFIGSEYYVHMLIMIFLFIIYTSALRFILSTGQLLFGAHGFIAIGAYASALMVSKLGLSFWIALPLAGATAAISAVIFGYVTLRLKGAYFAILTWCFAESIRFFFIRVEEPFGGASGIFDIPKPNAIPLPLIGSIDFSYKTPYYFLALGLMLVALLVLYRLEHSKFGLVFEAISERDYLAKSVGINIMRYKVLAFATGCTLLGVGGSFYAHYNCFISPFDFTILLTISLLVYAAIGGLDRFSGPIVGTVLLVIAGEFFAGYGFYKVMLYSVLMIVVLLFVPGGVAGLAGKVLARLRKREKVAEEHGAT